MPLTRWIKAEVLRPRAEANRKKSGELYGRGKAFQESEKPIEPVNTTAEVAKSAGVSTDTASKWRTK